MDDLDVHRQMNLKERQNDLKSFNVAQDTVNWQKLTSEVMNLLVSWNMRSILTR